MVRIPVYFDLNGVHQIAIYEEQDDGSFRRTMDQPMRLLRDNIVGIGESCGELSAARYDREVRPWATPTVLFRQRPQSYYEFLRDQLKQRKIYVFSRPSMNGRLLRFSLHELQLKPSVSMQVQSLLIRKLVEAVDLDMDHVLTEPVEAGHSVA